MNKQPFWGTDRIVYINAERMLRVDDKNIINAFVEKVRKVFIADLKIECYTVDVDSMGRVVSFSILLTDGYVSSAVQIVLEILLSVKNNESFLYCVCRQLLVNFSREKYLRNGRK